MENIVLIDMGHGRLTAGKRSPAHPDFMPFREYEFNREIGEELMRVLSKYPDILTMPTIENPNTGDVLQTRVNFANQIIKEHPKRNYLFLSIHANAFGTTWNTANGVEVFVSKNASANSKTAAAIFQRNLVDETGLIDRCHPRKYKQANFYVLKNTVCPAVLVECGFYTNLKEMYFLRSAAGKGKILRALEQSILEYFKINT